MGRSAIQHNIRKEQIIKAAMDCFAQFGYDGATNKIIATAANLNSAALIYHYFPSKENLFQACFNKVEALDEMCDVLCAHLDDPPERFFEIAATEYLRIVSNERLVRFMLAAITAVQSHAELPPILLSRIAKSLLTPMQLFFKKHGSENIFSIEPIVFMQMFYGPLIVRVFTAKPLQQFGVIHLISDEEFVKEFVKSLLHGISQQN